MSSRRTQFDIRQAGKQIFAVLVVLFLANTGFYLFYTKPKSQEYERMLDRGLDDAKLQEREAGVESRRLFLDLVKKAESDLDTLRNDVLSTKDRRLVEVQLEVEELARQFRITLQLQNNENEVLAEEGIERFVMVVPLEGGYTSLRAFLQAVENSTKFLVVEKVALAQGKEGGVMLQLNITLATYFNLPEEMLQQYRRRGGRGNA